MSEHLRAESLKSSLASYWSDYPSGISKQTIDECQLVIKKQPRFIFILALAEAADPKLQDLVNQIAIKGLRLTEDDYLILSDINQLVPFSEQGLIVAFGEAVFQELKISEDYHLSMNKVLEEQILIAASLSQIQSDSDEKRKFWEALKSYA